MNMQSKLPLLSILLLTTYAHAANPLRQTAVCAARAAARHAAQQPTRAAAITSAYAHTQSRELHIPRGAKPPYKEKDNETSRLTIEQSAQMYRDFMELRARLHNLTLQDQVAHTLIALKIDKYRTPLIENLVKQHNAIIEQCDEIERQKAELEEKIKQLQNAKDQIERNCVYDETFDVFKESDK